MVIRVYESLLDPIELMRRCRACGVGYSTGYDDGRGERYVTITTKSDGDLLDVGITPAMVSEWLSGVPVAA